jgi:hypothetical protein
MKRRTFFKCINRRKPYKHYPKYTSHIMCTHAPGKVIYTCGKLSVTRPDSLLDSLGFEMISAEDLVRL